MTRSFVIDNQKYYFSREYFKYLIREKCKQKKMKIKNIKTELAELTLSEESTVHNWMYGKVGPSSIDIVERIADYFQVDVLKLLTNETAEDDKMKSLTEQEYKSVYRIHKVIIDFMNLFLNTDGIFTGSDLIYGFEIPYESRIDFALSEYEKVRQAWQYEYVYLKDFQIYDDLYNFIENDLFEMFQQINDEGDKPFIDKCSGSYRYEPDEGKSASEDYDDTINKLYNLLDKYL